MALDLYEELRAVVSALDAAEIPYGLAGALAVAVHGAPRATTDIDLAVRVNANLEEAWASRTVYETEWGPLSVIARDALIRMKV